MTDTDKNARALEEHQAILRNMIDPAMFPEDAAPSPVDQIRFLEGPHEINDEQAILDTVDEEFRRAFATFNEISPCVGFFGSARTKPDDPLYEMGRKTAELIAREGFAIMTGGGPGMMQAANHGAQDAGGRSVGCVIELPNEESANPYVNRVASFKHFYVRKVIMVKYSFGFVVLPGGFGTMDEMFEILTLIQTGKIREFPLVLMGCAYWQKLYDFLCTTMVESDMINPEDIKLIQLTDDPQSACDHVTSIAKHRFELHKGAPAACRLDWEKLRGQS